MVTMVTAPLFITFIVTRKGVENYIRTYYICCGIVFRNVSLLFFSHTDLMKFRNDQKCLSVFFSYKLPALKSERNIKYKLYLLN